MKLIPYEYRYLPEPVKLLVKSIQNHLENNEGITYKVYDKDNLEKSYPVYKPRVWMIMQDNAVLGVCQTYYVNFKHVHSNMCNFISDNTCTFTSVVNGKLMVCRATDSSEILNSKLWDTYTEIEDIDDELYRSFMLTQLENYQMETAEEFCFEESD